jgi:hypothetical protein
MPGARRTHCLACKQKGRTQANIGTPKSLGIPTVAEQSEPAIKSSAETAMGFATRWCMRDPYFLSACSSRASRLHVSQRLPPIFSTSE